MRAVLGMAALAAALVLCGCTGAAPGNGAAPAAQVAEAGTAAGAPASGGDAAGGEVPGSEALPAPSPGFRGLFRGRGGPVVPLTAAADAGQELAAEGAGPALAAAPAQDQAPPFGQVVPACGLRGRALGREVARYPAKGAAQWKLYDSDPAQTGPRSHYVTGFKDGCPRRITAALGLFGSAGLHETWRYRQDNRSPWSKTDASYEALKAQLCGTGRGIPCPASRRAALERRTAFVTLYPRYGAEGGWFVLLLGEGQLIAASVSS